MYAALSGSGKSTLIRTVNQLERIESGEIWVDGINVADPKTDLNKVREEVGFVFPRLQSVSTFDCLGKYYLSPMKVKTKAVKRRKRKRWSFWNGVGLACIKKARCPVGFPAVSSSVGDARGLAMEPRVMLFDEPTSLLTLKWSAKY